jgi:hypothetical protein
VLDDKSHSFDRGTERFKGNGRAIGEAHRRYTRLKNFSDGVRGYLFQGRFGSCVLNERHLLAAARYVELNPVSAGIVSKGGSGLSVVQCSLSSWFEPRRRHGQR